jgi:hypothetical protein
MSTESGPSRILNQLVAIALKMNRRVQIAFVFAVNYRMIIYPIEEQRRAKKMPSRSNSSPAHIPTQIIDDNKFISIDELHVPIPTDKEYLLLARVP